MSERNPFRRPLHRNWRLQSSDRVDTGGEGVSRPGFDAGEWYPTGVPSTVLGTLVGQGVYPDPAYGTCLREIPTEPFEVPWWYRTEFTLSQEEASRTVILELDGVNHSADLWVNGQELTSADSLRGTFRRFRLDMSAAIRPGENVCALRVHPPRPGDYSTGFVDWNPPPPDRNLGLFRTVSLVLTEGVSIENPFVETRLDRPLLRRAELTVRAHLMNHRKEAVTGELFARIGSTQARQQVSLEPEERREIRFRPEDHEALRIHEPRLWWPHTLGEPALHELRLDFVVGDRVWHSTRTRFGIRTVEDYRTPAGHRGFKVNGHPLLIQGAGWTDDLLLRDTPESLESQIRYVRHLHLNAIRLEGVWGKDSTLYDLCDRYGILVMLGWSCQWEHESWLGKAVDPRFGGPVVAEDIELLARSWEDQVLWLRHHPSIFLWAVASDKLPHPDLERRYVEVFRSHDPGRPHVASTGGFGSEQRIITSSVIESDVSGATGMKMLGPYAYTPPVYWYTNRHLGGAYGFNTETGPGVQMPVLESIRRFIPEEHLWPVDDVWSFHCGLKEFSTLERFQTAMNHRLGQPLSLEEFVRKAQLLNYELMRPMFEAFRANRGEATGIVHWMLNAAWPKLYWQLYDWFLVPNAAFYAAREACRPLHVLYDYGGHSVHLVNERRSGTDSLRTLARMFDIESREVYRREVEGAAPPQSSRKVLDLPRPSGLSTTYFLDLRLFDASDTELDRNFYWLSTKPDLLDYEARVEPWAYYTPSAEYADLTQLNDLPEVSLHVDSSIEDTAEGRSVAVRLWNPGDRLAFFVELGLVSECSGLSIAPVFWEDNYLSLTPGESRRIRASLHPDGETPRLTVRGWNGRIEKKGAP